MLCFLNIIRGPQSDFVPEREGRDTRPATEHNAPAELEPGASDALVGSDDASPTPDPVILEAAIHDLSAQLRVAGEGAAKDKVAHERKVSRLRAQIKELKKAKAAAEKGYRRLRKRLRLARRNAARREADLQDDLDAANSKAMELLALNDSLRYDKARSSTEQTVTSARIQDLERKLAASVAENSTLEGELHRRNSQIEENSKLGEIMTLLYLEKEKTKSLEAQVAQLRRQLAEKDAFYTLEVDALQLASDMYESQEQDEHRARTIAERERDAMRTERDQALVNIASLQKIVDNQGARITELEEQYLAETLRADTLMAERDCHLDRLHDLEDALGDTQAQYVDAKQTSEQLRKDCQDTQEAYNYLQLILTLANASDEILQNKIRDMQIDNEELRASKQALEDFMFTEVPDCEASNSELCKRRSASPECISAPSTPPLPSSGSVSRGLPLGISISFNIASQVEATSDSPKTLRKTRSSRRFSTKHVDENANANASPQTSGLA